MAGKRPNAPRRHLKCELDLPMLSGDYGYVGTLAIATISRCDHSALWHLLGVCRGQERAHGCHGLFARKPGHCLCAKFTLHCSVFVPWLYAPELRLMTPLYNAICPTLTVSYRMSNNHGEHVARVCPLYIHLQRQVLHQNVAPLRGPLNLAEGLAKHH